jgi:hypothetical protein
MSLIYIYIHVEVDIDDKILLDADIYKLLYVHNNYVHVIIIV